MSNEQTVQDLYAAFGRGDLPAILDKLSDDVVWELEGPAVVSFSGVRHGKSETVGFSRHLPRTMTTRNSRSRTTSPLATRL